MTDLQKAMKAVFEKWEFLKRHSLGTNHICVSVYALAGELQIAPEIVEKVLSLFADFGLLSLSTWRNDLWREVNWREWRNCGFFRNPDDANYVRLRLV